MRYFADPEHVLLDNGMELYVVERPEQPAAELLACVRTGSVHEADFLGCGLSHFVEHMLFQGCKGYPGTAAGDRLGKLGGDANAYTSFDRTVYYVELPRANALAGLEILSAMIRYPEFPAKRFTAEREVILREAAMGFDNPGKKLGEIVRRQLFRRHPLRHPIIGYPGMVSGVTAEMARCYHRDRYTPDRIFFVLTGALSVKAAAEVLNRQLGDWKRRSLQELQLPDEPPQFALRQEEFVMPDALSRVIFSSRLPGIRGIRTAPFEIASGLLGAGDAAYLVKKLQFDQELAVDLDSSLTETAGETILGIFAAAEPEKCRRLVSALQRELALIRKTTFRPAEIRREKLQHKMETLQELRTNAGIAASVAGAVFSGDGPLVFDRCMDAIDRVTPEDVHNAMEIMLDPDHFCVGIQTPEAAVKPAVSRRAVTPPEPVKLASCAVYLGNPGLPLCDLAILLPGGDLFTDPRLAGINALAAELMTCGSDRFSEDRIAEKLDELGVDLSITAAPNSFSIRATLPRKTLERTAEFLAEILAHPDFAVKPFERERRAMLAEYAAKLQRPAFAAQREIRRRLFRDHPYANNTRLSDTLPGITPEDVRAFYDGLWLNDRTVFAFGGDLREEEADHVLDIFREKLPLHDGTSPEPAMPVYPMKSGNFRIRLPREQQVIALGIPAPSSLEVQDSLAFQVLHDSLNGITGRLYKVIRERHALAYSTGMTLRSGFQPGYAAFHASTSPEKGDKTEKLLRQTLQDLADNGLSETEFQEARNNEVFAMERILAQPEECLFEAALSVFYHRGPDDVRRTMERLKKCRRCDINRILKKHLDQAVIQCVRSGG